MRRLQALAALLAAVVTVPPVLADGSGPMEPFPITGAYSAFFREDREQITIIDFAGNYNKELAAGVPNVEPRAVIAREFFRTHPDRYDFLVAFSTFEFVTGEALAFHWLVQNDVQGVGLPQFDNSALFGSNSGKLQGFTDMAALSRYTLDAQDPGFELVLRTLGHEILHQWASFVRFRNPDGTLNQGLIGRQNSHWSYLLDTDASVQYGAEWRDNGDGTFTSVGARTFYSPLDLYLMGLYRPEEVPPFFLIENPQIDKTQLPAENVTVTGTRRNLTVQDIIGAEGARVPAAGQAQKEFRIGFILIAGPDEPVTDAQITALNAVRNGFMTRFSILTGGRAVAHVFPEARPTVTTGTPDEVGDDNLRTTPVNIGEALAWLRGRQEPQGYFQDKTTTAVRDTTIATTALATLDVGFVGAQQALQWLSQNPSANTDYLARHARLITDLAGDASALRTQLRSRQNADGGWGLASSYHSNPLDTALALLALAGDTAGAAAIDRAAQYLIASVNADGGWSPSVGSPSRTTVTTTALRALQSVNRHATVSAAALAWLAARQNVDGGFGDSPSTIHDTANTLQTFMALDAMAQIRGGDASTYLAARQTTSGSWDGSVYATATAVGALRRLSSPNWVLSSIAATPTTARDGDRVRFTIAVKNDGNAAAPANFLRLYDGDPASGGVQVGADLSIPLLAPGAGVTFTPLWDSFNRAGAHTFFAVIDPLGAQSELTRTDNRKSIAVTVQAAPAGVDLTFGVPEITLMPAQPNRLPSTIGVSLNVRNLGLANAQNVLVRLWAGAPGGALVGASTLDVLARTTVPVNFSHVLTQPGALTFTAQLDPNGAIAEANEADNTGSASLATVPSLDLVVRAADISVDKSPAAVGDDVNFSVTLRNEGTSDTPTTQVRYTITDGNTTQELLVNTLQLNAGQSTQQTIPWRVNLSGSLTFSAQLDPAGLVPELDEGNNAASRALSAGNPAGPNLVVSFQTFTATPNPAREGYPLSLSAAVRNSGTQVASNVQVAFYNGDPASGGTQIGATQTIASLAAGATATVGVEWSAVPNSADKLLFVVADPANQIAEFSETDNAAFNVIAVLSLPDLAISAGDVQLAPAFPRSGEAVVVTARVANLGAQGVTNVLVRAYDGDPAAGGVPFGGDQTIAGITGFGFGIATFNWTASATAGGRALFVRVDPAGAILERTTTNNTARRDVTIQDGNLSTTERYISPDGDGVKDATQLAFRLQSEQTVSVEVRNRRDKVVRRFAGGALEATTGGTVVWNGLDDLGRVVQDGTYRMRIVSATGGTIGEAVVEVDTNRSSLLAADGTKFAVTSNLSCELPNISSFTLTGDDSTGFFSTSATTGSFTKGIWRMAGDGTDIRVLVPTSVINTTLPPQPPNYSGSVSRMAVAANGSTISYVRTDNQTSADRYWAVDGDGRNLRRITPLPDFSWLSTWVSPDGATIYTVTRATPTSPDQLVAIPASGTGPVLTLLTASNISLPNTFFSPDFRSVLVFSNSDGGTITVVDTRTAASTVINAGFISNSSIRWAPDSTRFAYPNNSTDRMLVYGRDGTLHRTILPPIPTSPGGGAFFDTPQWSSSSSEFAFQFQSFPGDQPDQLIVGGIYVADLATDTVERVAEFTPQVPSPGESYHISTWNGSQWVERGVLHYSLRYREQTLDLASFLPDANGLYRVRIRQAGKEAAHVESVALISAGQAIAPTVAQHLGNSSDVLARVAADDHIVLDLFGAEMEVRWDAQTLATKDVQLALKAREEVLSNRNALPFSYPVDAQRHYEYQITGDRTLLVDGNQTAQDNLAEPLFEEFSRPNTGHPSAKVRGFAQSDAQYLYAALDFTVDNTEDDDKDWASLRVRAGGAWKEFRVTAQEQTYGSVGFITTGTVSHPHKYYEFRIPLGEIGASVGDAVSISFQAYGTAAIIVGEESLLTSDGDLYWVPGERSLVYKQWSGGERFLAILLDEENRQVPVFRRFHDDAFGFGFSPSGRQAMFLSNAQALDPTSVCFQQGTVDHFSYRSLLNLTADLRAVRSAKAGGIQLKGSASDLNFSTYTLEYATVAAPAAWSPIAPAAGQPVVDDLLTTWVPPAAGNYFVRLSVQDLAGNLRRAVRRVTWSETPSITDLYREPQYISPNGDGVNDTANIHYRVLEPVHLTFEFLNAAGKRVRTITRDHSAAGVEVNVPWDGRDDNGLPVADGRYRLVVQNYEFFITVDSTPPVALMTVREAYQPLTVDRPDKTEVVLAHYEPGFEWKVRDENLEQHGFEIGAGVDPQSWSALNALAPCAFPIPPKQGRGPWTPRAFPHPERECTKLPLDTFTNHRFRLTARDRAGNRVVSTAAIGAEQVILRQFGNHVARACAPGAACPPDFERIFDTPHAPLSNPNGHELPLQISRAALRLTVAETVRAQVAQLFVQYRLLEDSTWSEAPLTQFLDSAGEVVPRYERLTPGVLSDHELRAVWDMAGVQGGRNYAMRLRALDSAGASHFSNVARFFTEGLTLRGLASESGGMTEAERIELEARLRENPPQAGERAIWGREFIGEPIASLKMFLRSEQDPRFAIAREIGELELPNSTFTFNVRDLKPCTTYFGSLVGRTALRSMQTTEKEIRIKCLELEAKAEPVQSETCGAPAPERLRFQFAPMSLDGTGLKLLTLSRPLAGGGEDIVFNVNRPRATPKPKPTEGPPAFIYDFELDTTGIAEGPLAFTARLINDNDDEVTQSVNVRVDRTPAAIQLTYPPEGQLLCGVSRTYPNGETLNVLPFEGSITDAGGFHYELRHSGPAGETKTFHRSRELDSRTRPSAFPLRPKYPDTSETGTLAELSGVDGAVTVELQVDDRSGIRQCLARAVEFDGRVDGATATTDRKLFSPNGDDLFDEVVITHTVEENATLRAELFAAQRDAEGRIARVGDALAVLRNDVAILAGSGDFTWDGRNGSGAVVADGLYAILLTFTDGCGNRQVGPQLVTEVDNTPPGVVVAFPTPTSQLPTMVEVQGTANDLHPDTYAVDYGVDATPQTWARLVTHKGSTGPTPEVLAVWNTFGMAGPHAVRVVAVDQVGNERIVAVPVTIGIPVNLISYLDAQPPLFSPNNDNKAETTSIRFGVEQPVLATVTIQTVPVPPATSGTVLRTLTSVQALQPGPGTIAWDGRNDAGTLLADGRYSISLQAALASDPLVRQEERVTVTVDRTAPLINIMRPANGFVPASGGIVGTISDANLTEYLVAITDTPASPQWQTLDTGEVSRVNAVFGGLADREEGDYALKVEARDQGEIESSVVIPFVIDNTPPKAGLTAPETGSVVGVGKGVVNVKGSVDEANLATWRLSVGSGGSPTSLTELAAGTSLPLPAVLRAWDVSSLADGLYTLELRADDKAGLSGTSRIQVIVDNTPPATSITAPAALGYVTRALDVTGSASDTNFVDYTLEVAPGAIGASSRWTEVGAGTQIVQNGVLLRLEALPPEGVHTLRISARDKADNRGAALVQVTVDTIAPAAPAGLTAAPENGTAARLNWTANTEPDLAGYAVYRNGVRITPTLLTAATYLDAALAEAHYEYAITAFDRAGLESERSNVAGLTIDVTPPTTRISFPGHATMVSGLLDVQGTAYSADDFREYRLSVGAGANPADYQLLRRSPVPTLGDVLTQWNAVVLAEGAQFTLQLEGEDIRGNVGVHRVTVTIDNLPPAAPTGLVATPNGSNIQLNWTANTEPDLLGYVVFRNERIANQTGVAVGSLKQYAVTTNAYLDAALPDARYVYYVLAIDRAGNLSNPSNTAMLTLDNRAPRATIVQPEANALFDEPLFVLATSPDSDIANVQFQYRALASPTWLNLGAADTTVAYEATLDPVARALTFGDYRLRAVATDVGGRIDTAPPEITVRYRDLTRPARVLGVTNRVVGGSVTLNWLANTTDADLAGYHVGRTNALGTTLRVTTTPITATTFVDNNVPDAAYQYRVIAVDTSTNEADGSAPSDALVYTPTFRQPYTPVPATVTSITGQGKVQATVSGEIANGLGTTPLAPFATGPNGEFTLNDVPLASGVNAITLRLTDAATNVSKPVTVQVTRGAPPSAPTGVQAVANGFNVTVSWNANPESDIIGYSVYRNEGPLQFASLVPTNVSTATASSQHSTGTAPSLVLDTSVSTYWSPLTSATQPSAGQWLSYRWSTGPRPVIAIQLIWWSAATRAIDYDIEALNGTTWVPVAEVRDNEDRFNDVFLERPYRASEVRIVLRRIALSDAAFRPVRLAQMRVLSQPLVTGTQFVNNGAPNGVHQYTVTAMNANAFESAPSAPAQLPVGDVTAPAPVVLSGSATGPDVSLSWTASASPDVDLYAIYRNGELVGVQSDINDRTYLDEGLANGTYTYTVTALDTANNESVPSNALPITVSIAVPPTPLGLAVANVPAGMALDLSWNAAAGTTVDYAILRSLTSGGPYTEVGTTAATQFRDIGLVNGTTYFYVVAARDQYGNRSVFSNPASGTPLDQQAPVSSIHHPTRPGVLYTAPTQSITVIGRSEPAALVTLQRNGTVVAQATARATAAIKRIHFDDAFEPPVMSPDGRHAVYQSGDGKELRLVDVTTDEDTLLVALADEFEPATPHWTADGSEIVYRDTQGCCNNYVRAYRLADGTIRNLTAPAGDDVEEALISPDGRRLMVRDGSNLLEVDTTTGVRTLLINSNPRFDTLRWSPDGTRVAYERFSPADRLVILHIASRTEVIVDAAAGIAPPSWAPDGSALAFVSERDGSRQVWRYALADGATTRVTGGALEFESVAWSPDGRAIAYGGEDSGGFVVALASGTVTSLGTGNQPAEVLDWTAQGQLAMRLYFVLSRVTPAGRVEFNGVALNRGDNVLAMAATDTSGNIGALSQPVVVSYGTGTGTDLAITDADVRVIPAAPILGETARVTVSVANVGSAPSAAADLMVLAVDPSGGATTLIEGRVLNPIQPGGRQSLSADWTAQAPAGEYSIVAIVDARNEQAERSEANNLGVRAVQVISEAGQQVLVANDRASYDAGAEVHATITVRNFASTFAGRLVVAVEDQQGFLVATVLDAPVADMVYAAERAQSVTWATTNTFAGAYQVHARLFDAGGTQVAESTAPFALEASSRFSASVTTDRAIYVANTGARASGTYSYAGGNTPVDGAQLLLRILNASDTVIAESSQPLGDMLPGATGTLALDWNTGTHPVGVYRAVLSLTRAGATLAGAQAPLLIDASTAQLNGTLALSELAPAPGTPQGVSYTVRNLGNTAFSQLPIVVNLVDPQTLEPLQTRRTLTDISVGAQASNTVSFDTTALGIRTYTVQLQAELTAGGQTTAVTLQTAAFTLADRAPPAVSIFQPAANGIVRGDSLALAFARDAHSSVRDAQLSVDGGAWQAAPIRSVQDDHYGFALAALADGPHTITARATDTAGNTATSATVSFVVDNTAPQIVVTGATEGGRSNVDVTLQVAVTDPNLASTTISLNNVPYVPGTAIAGSGQFHLRVSARDAAGNNAVRELRFVIDRSPPLITISGVEHDAFYNVNVTPVITVTDADPATYNATLNGQPFTSGTLVSAEGTYDLVVNASDLAGNQANRTVRFTIDKTAPVTTITQPANNSTQTSLSTTVTGTTEPLATVFLTVGAFQVNGAADANGLYSFSQVPLAVGANSIVAYGRDRANNTGPTVSVNVTVTTSNAPQVVGELITHHSVLVYVPGNVDTSANFIEGVEGVRTAGSNPATVTDQYTEITALLEAIFATQQIDYLIVRNETAFVEALRTRRHDLVVLTELADPHFLGGDIWVWLENPALHELKASVAAGTGLVWIRTHGDTTYDEAMKHLFGGKTNGSLFNTTSVVLPNGAASVAGTHTYTDGRGLKIQLMGGTRVGDLLPSNRAAMVISQYGDGRTALMAYNPADLTSPQAGIDTLTNVINYAKPTANALIPGGVARVRWNATQLSGPAEVELRATLPSGMKFVTAVGGTISNAQNAVWNRQVTGNSTSFTAVVRLPLARGTHAIDGDLYRRNGANLELVDEDTLNVSVTEDRDDLGVELLAEINGLTVTSGNQFRQSALECVQEALIHSQTTQEDAAFAIENLYRGLEDLRRVLPLPSSTMAKLGRLMHHYEASWYSFEP